MILYLLPYLINPPRAKNIGKRSIREKQEAFFVHVEPPNDLHDAVQRQRIICATVGTTLQPISVIVGPLVKLDAFSVYINDSMENPTIYRTDSMLQAINLSFQIFLC